MYVYVCMHVCVYIYIYIYTYGRETGTPSLPAKIIATDSLTQHFREILYEHETSAP